MSYLAPTLKNVYISSCSGFWQMQKIMVATFPDINDLLAKHELLPKKRTDTYVKQKIKIKKALFIFWA
jgi:hypothetical protein